MKDYTTVSGDTWDIIAFKVYGKEVYAKELLEANPKLILTTVFSSSVTIRVPEISVPINSSLPPWKRGV